MSNENTKDSDKVAVNGEEAALDPTRRNQITLQLLQNGGVKRVEAKLKQALDEAGWSQAIREQADLLLRSGETMTYDETKQRVLEMMRNNENGPTREGSTPTSLQPTREALQHGADQVKKELEGIMVLKKKDDSSDVDADYVSDSDGASQSDGNKSSGDAASNGQTGSDQNNSDKDSVEKTSSGQNARDDDSSGDDSSEGDMSDKDSSDLSDGHEDSSEDDSSAEDGNSEDSAADTGAASADQGPPPDASTSRTARPKATPKHS